ncbi:MAG: hypothetical protein GY822_26475 [Deltaproteobacteria bacterium]|nr:hypothetical protein [Deltaproteobacteria bacterium]
MSTARETLFNKITAMAATPKGDDAVERVRALMTSYRVQTKPGTEIPEGATARDALGDLLLEIWSSDGDKEELFNTTISRYRMQSKQPAGAKKPRKPRAPKKMSEAPAAAMEPAPAPMPRQKPAAPLPPRIEPVAGGPRKRGRTRSECPKCHSMGVVLAHSYAGDEYFSCIYCGWQAFKPADNSDPTASLAVRLLGQSGKDS